jgi:deoxyadenosine/deoxycytidine kinase
MRLVLAGAIAVGKSTVAQALEKRLPDAIVVPEPIEELRFLPRFYADPLRWSLASRLELLAHKARLWAEPVGAAISVYDRGVHELLTFARVLAARGELPQDELAVYEQLYELLVASLPPPDLVVWCRCETGTCLDRIGRRARPFEQAISGDYIAALDAEYRRWVAGLDQCEVFVYDTTDEAPETLDAVVAWVSRHAGR